MPIPEIKSDYFPKTAKERVYSTVKEWIIDGTLTPGEKIFDKEIAEFFSVSRTPVREAFQMLEEQKLITISPGKESRVSEINLNSVRQSYEILAVLEPLAVKYAMDHITKEDLSDLQNATEQFKDAILSGNSKAANIADHQFHEIILQTSQNDFLLRFCTTLETHISRTEMFFFSHQDVSDLLAASVKEHSLILHAMEQGDTCQAEKIMADNWLNTIPYVEKYLSTEK